MEHIVSKDAAVAEAPDLGSFQPVVHSYNGKSAARSQPSLKTGDTTSTATDANAANLKDDSTHDSNTNSTTTQQQQPPTQPEKQKKKKKKKKSDDTAMLEAKFELPSHLVPLESDTPAQKLKKTTHGQGTQIEIPRQAKGSGACQA